MLVGALELDGKKTNLIRNSLFPQELARDMPCLNCGGYYHKTQFAPTGRHYEKNIPPSLSCQKAKKYLDLFKKD